MAMDVPVTLKNFVVVVIQTHLFQELCVVHAVAVVMHNKHA